MEKTKEILCTIGPKILNKKFLKSINKKISLIRINMSHLEISDLKKMIFTIKNNCTVPICIDTEGAQIRTKVKREIYYKKGKSGYIQSEKGKFNFYPKNVFKQLKKDDILDIGFKNLKIKLTKKNKERILFKAITNGKLENNKGVHIINRKIKLDFITEKDKMAINIAKKLKIKNFALSFANSHHEIKKFNSLLPTQKKIFKIETINAIKNLDKMFRYGKYFLIDRGDLSKEINIEKIPFFQRFIFKKAEKFSKVKIYVATNFLESMIDNPYPTRGEANDIFNSLEMGAAGLVLTAETAIGKYPMESINFLSKMIKYYSQKSKIIKFNK